MPNFDQLTLADLRAMANGWPNADVTKQGAFISWLNSISPLPPGGEEEQIIIQHAK